MEIRNVEIGDAKQIAEIYAYYVKNTAITFEYDAPDEEEFKKRILNITGKYPFIVAEENGNIMGYAYAKCLGERRAYYPSVELSVYVKNDLRKSGVGSALYKKIEQLLKKQNITNLYACIACTDDGNDSYLNGASVAFHEKKGYKTVGHFNGCGEKFGRRYGVIWMEKLQ